MTFPEPTSKAALEGGDRLTPRFDANGLVTAVVTDPVGTLLMVAMMNDEALRLTLDVGEAHFWSRSRNELWRKGATSGNVLKVREVRVDCDQDAVWVVAKIEGDGAACHTGERSCFYRRIVHGRDGLSLQRVP